MRELRAAAERLSRVAVAMFSCTWLLGTLIALFGLAWFLPPARVVPGTDTAWQLGLQLALADGLDFGSQVVFTYGPLIFTRAPVVAVEPYAALGAIYVSLLRVALGVSLLWAARRTFPLWLALPLALVVAVFSRAEPVLTLALIWCLVALAPDSPPRVRELLPACGGVLSAIESLARLNIGPTLLLMGLLTVLAIRERRIRNLAVYLGSFVVAFSALWLATGQGLANFGSFLRASFEVVSGYSTAMAVEGPMGSGTFHVVAAIGMLLAALIATYLGNSGAPRGRRAAAILVVSVAGFAVWKAAFVREGFQSMPFLFSVTLVPWLALPWRRVSMPRLRRVGAPAFGAVGLLATAALFFPLSHAPVGILDPITNAKNALKQFGDAVIPSRFDRTRADSKAELRRFYRLDPKTLALLRGRTVYVEPAEISLAWAYDLNWDPLPVLQSYVAYTPYLDRLNESALVKPGGPERVLRTNTGAVFATDGSLPQRGAQAADAHSAADLRYRPWDQPATTLAMLCHFVPLGTTQFYQVLGRSQDRCGTPHQIGSRAAGYNSVIRVPQGTIDRPSIVFARVHGLEPSGWEKIRTLFYRAASRFVVFNREVAYKVVPQTAPDGLILAARGGGDYPPPFALAPNARTLEFQQQPELSDSSEQLRIDFFAMPVRPLKVKAPIRQGGAPPPRASEGAPP